MTPVEIQAFKAINDFIAAKLYVAVYPNPNL